MNAPRQDTRQQADSDTSKPPANPPDNDNAKAGVRGTDERGAPPVEIGGRDGPDPTRYGDWEKAGRCIDF